MTIQAVLPSLLCTEVSWVPTVVQMPGFPGRCTPGVTRGLTAGYVPVINGHRGLLPEIWAFSH